MEKTGFRLKVVCPEGTIIDEKVSSVKLPASDGQIGVLTQHERYVTNLGVGVLEYQIIGTEGDNNSVKKLVIVEGFCNVDGDVLVVLADRVIIPSNTKPDDLASEKATAQVVLSNSQQDSVEWSLAKTKLAEIEALAQILS